MQKIKILTDSTCDIPKEEEKRLGIKIMCFPVTVDGVSYRERQDFSNAEFYKMMDNAKEMPTTSQLTAYEILEVYKELYSEGWTDVIYVTISSTGSATYNNALSAAQTFKEEVLSKDGPKMRIHVVDSKNYTGVYGYPVMQAALKAQKGATSDEIIDYLHTDNPAWGARQMSAQLKARGYHVGRRKTRRYMKEMDIYPIYPKMNLSKRMQQAKVSP